MKLKVTALSDRGLVRGNNEDSAYGGTWLLALADGMGGHAAGEVASQLMITRLERIDKDPGGNDMLSILAASARDANVDIKRHVDEHPETEGMGTTLSALMFNGSEFGVIHVGDSRGYRLRDGKIEQITKDDTFVQSLVDQGKLDPADVSSHPQKSLILKAYTGHDVEPTLFMLDAKVGDRLLLCSDGLSDPVTATTIESALKQGSVEDAAQMLVELALRSGGPDNVTVVIAEVVEGSSEASSPHLVGAIAGELPEPTHPDSAASRAAKLNRAVPSTTAQTMAHVGDKDGEGGSEDSEPAPRGKLGWIVVSSILVVLIAVVAAGLWAKNAMTDRYYVATDGEITVQQGTDFELFGRALHSTYQHACLNEKGELGLRTADCTGDFSPFTLEALPASERSAAANLGAGSYDEVQGQLVRLAEKTLPVCEASTKPADAPKRSASATPSATTSAAPSAASSAQPSSSAAPSPTSTIQSEPGVNCREVK
ncbi:Ser/Thr phosphatase, PP2C family [Corynebacterium sp. CMW7794]|uniref:PP2C family protein-serine/threonine phosphatase n=1 Tax=Corynebacterium sp. CMW7794 TaxID=1603887 RepID=UPI000793E827|nr:protein phosphatase 2C domain-containing protein [Corynebacterium sp. CMW7794]KXI17935.1 Ser/Thr phosphatase, PP2C family [Corynebacterium sp. CMW7794]